MVELVLALQLLQFLCHKKVRFDPIGAFQGISRDCHDKDKGERFEKVGIADGIGLVGLRDIL
jgi:hypothetical protein